MTFDILIQNATVYDGISAEGYTASVGIRGDRIAAVGALDASQGERVIEARNLSLFPGFIDTHTHSDAHLLSDRTHACALLQGVTTEIVGPCGLGYFPLTEAQLEAQAKYLEGLNGPVPPTVKFRDAAGYLEAVSGCGINVAAYVSHGALRLSVLGFANTPMNRDALDSASRKMHEAAEQGVVGFSTGMSYYPASYADDEELVNLSKIAAECGIPLAAHCRTIFPDNRYDMDSRYEEFIDITRMARCSLHFSHTKHKPFMAGEYQAFLEPFEKAINQGMDITMEFYPYQSGAGFAVIHLPGWLLEGGYEMANERLVNPVYRPRLERELAQNEQKIASGIIAYAKNNRDLVGLTFAQAAQKANMPLVPFFIRFMAEEKMAVGFHANTAYPAETIREYEKDYIHLMEKPYYTIGSDSEPALMLPHQRTFDTFPKLLRLAREAGQDWSVFAACACSRAARIFKLKKRGAVKEGWFADLVLVDAGKMDSAISASSKTAHPAGIAYVLVNGRVAVEQGAVTGVLNGRGLRRGRE